MFDKSYEDRLAAWAGFRSTLEVSKDPIQDTIDFFNKAPLVNIQTDPYTPSSWPDPWELIKENIYCAFVKILAICYTLQLTDVLSKEKFEIHITHDNKRSSTYYLLYVGDRVIGFEEGTHVCKTDIPNSIISHHEYPMLALH
tara:strand:+ start:41 stop:466 length:426 start_codon:yes stop_codon:yes gene_type:complete